jgi:hypothetical protein
MSLNNIQLNLNNLAKEGKEVNTEVLLSAPTNEGHELIEYPAPIISIP